MTQGSESGFTLIELIMTMAIMAITLTFVVSGMSELISRGRLDSSAQKLYDLLTLARSEAIVRNRNLFVNITDGASWCIGLDDTAACNCGTSGDCSIDGAEKVIQSTDFSGIMLDDGGGLASFRFDPRNGIPEQTNNNAYTQSTYTFSNSAGNGLSIVINPVGRLRVCSSTTPPFRGYASC
jgi:type IV fimbrial biogenesis protein FimT